MAGSTQRVERRLAAILAADVVGSSRLIEADEQYALAAIHEVLHDVLISTAALHGGRLIKTMGDGALVEFASPVEAAACALEVQNALAKRMLGEPEDRRVLLRIGVNLGDVVAQPDGDLYGDGVNVAARLEGIADPGGIAISAKVHDELQGKVSLSFEDRGEQRLKNIARPVRIYALADGEPAKDRPKRLALPDKPSIAVLPFENMSGPDVDYFCDSLVEDIITALSRVKWFFVIARNSTFTYKGRAVDVRQVGRELGVRYVLEGSVRKAGDRVRITGQLIEAETSHHVWADRFESSLENVFELQDQITESVVGAIEPTLRAAEIERAQAKPTRNLRAYDLCLRALPSVYLAAATREDSDQALRLLYQAIQLDPDYSVAKATAAWAYVIRKAQTWSTPQEDEEGLRLAESALARHRDDPTVLACAGHALAFLGWRYEGALTVLDRAIKLNTNSARALVSNGWVRNYVGDAATALRHFARAIRLSPLDPETGYTRSGIAFAHLIIGKHEEAFPAAQQAVEEAPNFSSAHRVFVFALVQLGRIAEAKVAAERLRIVSPTFPIAWVLQAGPWRDRAFVSRYAEALRVAGVPES